MSEEFKDKEQTTQDKTASSLRASQKESTEEEKKEEERAEEEQKEPKEPKEKARSLYQKVQTMSVPEKIQLAMKGDKEARTLLIRDSNILVASSVLKSPKITESEVQQIAQSKSIDLELLKMIARSKEWLSKYKIKVALVNNPKTPLHISLTLLRTLKEKDIRLLSKNKNIPTALLNNAKQRARVR